MRNWCLPLLTLFAVMLQPAVFAADGLRPDPALMEAKGYSQELIHHTGRQTLRQEWTQQQTPYRSKWAQFKRNLWRNDWTGALEEFAAPSLAE
jgi:hypothetical protein